MRNLDRALTRVAVHPGQAERRSCWQAAFLPADVLIADRDEGPAGQPGGRLLGIPVAC